MAFTYLLVFGAALVTSLSLTPLVIRLGKSLRLYDPRGARKMHTVPIPPIGGVSIVLSMMLVSVAVLVIDGYNDAIFKDIQTKLILLFATSGFMFVIGLIDDIYGLRAIIKLLAQVLAALVICFFGIRIGRTNPNFTLLHEYAALDWLLTVIWIVAITNAVNLIDGLDGLCAGICAAACGVIAAFALYNGKVNMAILMLVMLGSLTGFLVFNFNPARIFMGDSGSMFLGFFLAVSSMVCATKVETIMGLLLPALALGLPIFDMILAVIRRILDRRSVFSADKEHVHHRLVQKGIGHRKAVIILYLITLLIASLGVSMMFLRGHGEIIVVLIALLVLISLFRIAGVLSFRSMWAQMQENLSRQREMKRERDDLTALQDRFRAAWTKDQWWRAVRRMARRMGFAKVTVETTGPDGGLAEPLVYVSPGMEAETKKMKLIIPMDEAGDGPLQCIEIEVPVDRPLENIGRRVAMFGRMVDEHMYIPSEDQDGADIPQDQQPS